MIETTTNTAWDDLNQRIVVCQACPRLVGYRQEVARVKRRAFQDWDYWGRPVAGFGDRQAQLLLLGLAPGAHGSNRTGRMFTGDSSGETLSAAMYRAGFASQPSSQHREDGLVLNNAFITAVARCVPPDNKPTRQEIDRCLDYLGQELDLLSEVRVVLALGQIAFEGYLHLLAQRGVSLPRLAFRHGGEYTLPSSRPVLLATYHPSRQNTQTGRLTDDMLDAVFAQAKALLA